MTKEQQLDLWRNEVPYMQKRIEDAKAINRIADINYYQGQLAMLERVIHLLEYDIGIDNKPGG